MRFQVQCLAWLSWGSSIAISCGIGQRCSSDLVLLWLWYRPVAVGPIRLLAWELPYATGAALKSKKKKKKSKKKKEFLSWLSGNEPN